MKVTVEAYGLFKKYIKDISQISIDDSCSLIELKVLAGIPSDKGASYVVNDKVVNKEYVLKDNDHVKFIMIIGAG